MRKHILSIILFFLMVGLVACQRRNFEEPEVIIVTPEINISLPEVIEKTDEVEVLKEAQQLPELKNNWEEMYTSEKSVSDENEIVDILNELYDRYLAQINKPGWYRLPFVEGIIQWVHVNNPEALSIDGAFTLYDYPKIYSGYIWPGTVLSLDGEYGMLTSINESLDDYYFYTDIHRPERLMPEKTWENLDWFLSCVRCIGSLNLKYQLALMHNPEMMISPKSEKTIEFQGWVEEENSVAVFVLKTKTEYQTNHPYVEDGRKVQIREEFSYFNLQNGGLIREHTDRYYTNGSFDKDDVIHLNLDQLEYFEELPEREQAIYDEACQKLREFNRSN